MSHVDPEALAGLALGDTEPLPASGQAHLAECPACQADLDELRDLVLAGRAADPRQLLNPPRSLLARIEQEVRQPAGPVAVAPAPPGHGPQQPGPRRASAERGRRRAWTYAAVAAAAGVLVGVGGVVLSERAGNDIVATAALTALPGHTGHGQVQLVKKAGAEQLQVEVEGGLSEDTFRELWLINTDGRRMVSLGTLPTSGRGSYVVPPILAAGLAGYTIVDVSIEPNDGNAAHSRNSLVRGVLPS